MRRTAPLVNPQAQAAAMGALDPNDLTNRLLAASNSEEPQSEEAKKAAFKKRVKSHYKGEFNAAALLR